MQILTLNFDLKAFGAVQNDVLVKFYMRSRSPFVANGSFDASAIQAIYTSNGTAIFKAFSSPDLATAGFADAYYVIECAAIGLKVAFWVPDGDDVAFASGDLSRLVQLVPPDGLAAPPPGSTYGWSPVLALVADGERRVQRVADWQGGAGAKPASGLYVGAAGLVADIADAVDVRGAGGLQGPVGDKGATGDKGFAGDKGPVGDKGATGDKGFTGDKGATGDPGLAGDDALKAYIAARGMNLLANGSGLLDNNTNFTAFTFDPQETRGGGGSFRLNAIAGALTDEYIPVDTTRNYRLSAWGKAGDTNGGNFNPANSQYLGVACVDADFLGINPYHYSRVDGAVRTYLAQDLNIGDTTITLVDATGWFDGANSGARHLRWYGYANSKGYTYPNHTYSRLFSSQLPGSGYEDNGTWGEGAIAGNVITLTAPWPGPNIPFGVAVDNCSSGGGYKYIAMSGDSLTNQWVKHEGWIGGEDINGGQNPSLFPFGTAFLRLVFLVNLHGVADTNVRWSNLWFSELSRRNEERDADTVHSTGFGPILQSANGHFWRQTISNAGVASWVDLGTVAPS